MESPAVVVWETLLRLVGAFYALTAPLVLRAAAMDALLDKALNAITMSAEKPRQRTERHRRTFLVANGILIGIGGVWLMALASVAAVFFATCALAYGAYLLVIAPRWLDPLDPPDENGRRQTRNALIVYLVATALVLAALGGGTLVPLSQLSAAVFWFAVGLSALIPVYAAWLFIGPRPTRKGWSTSDEDEQDNSPEDGIEPRPPAWRALLVPTWDRGVLVDPLDFTPIHELEGIEITVSDRDLMREWQSLFRAIADPDDPLRQRLLHPERLGELKTAGRAVHERLGAKLPPDRLCYEPLPRPHLPAVFPSAIKVMADYQCLALWHDGGVDVGSIDPDDLGLSYALTWDLTDWAHDFDSSLNWCDPGGPSPWPDERFAEHNRKGDALAERLRDELAQTGRGEVAVRHVPRPVATR